MSKWVSFLIVLIGLTLVACVGGERSKILLTPVTYPPSTVVVQSEPLTTNSFAESTPKTASAPQINIKTESALYRQGESIVATIENNSDNPIHFLEICSLHLCIESGEEWVCEERECDGAMTVLEPGNHLDVLQEAKSIVLGEATDIRSRYKLDYQIVSEAPFYFAYSNEFTVQSAGMHCLLAKQIALEHVQSSPYWDSIDTTRATVRWQDENNTCMVDFAWEGSELMRTGLWTEGYYVIVSSRTGQVIEENAYER